MSLLDDVSIVVTPNGYKAGTLFGVIPVPTLGTEEVVNGDFATDSDWAKGTGWTISGGTANANTSGSYINFYQNSVFTIGKAYQYEFTISNYSQGEVRFTQGGVDISGVKNANGTYTGVFSASQTSLYFQGVSSFIGSIDNVSVKEWVGADMDVTRATAATRVDENGLVNYAEILGGEEVTNGDGGSTSGWDLAYANTTLSIDNNNLRATANSSGAYGLSQSLSLDTSKQYIIKATIDVDNASGGTANLRIATASNLGSGVTTLSSATGTSTTILSPSASTMYIGIVDTANDSSNYVEIDNVSVKEVTRDNVPRIDYTGGGCPHILAEPMRTNLIPYSEDFSNAIWTKSGSSVTPNATTSPDGTINADKLVEDTSTGGHQIQSITSATNSTIYTTSVFVKYAGREWIRFTDAQSSNRIHFNTLTGVFGTISGTVIDYNKTALENGWYKLSFTTTSVATAYTPRIALAEADNDVSYTGDGVSGVYIYGCSLELGSYATSYIPTSGSTVTRNQDIFTRDGIGSLINSTEGVLFAEWKPKLSSDYSILSINNGTSGSSVLMGKGASSSTIFIGVRSGYGYQMLYTLSPYDFTNFIKVAVKWKVNDFAVWIDGVEVATDTSGNAPVGLNKLSFDFGDGGFDFYGEVKQLQVYKTALSDDTLALLTS